MDHKVSATQRRFAMSRTTILRKVSLLALLVVLSASQTGSVSAGINVWTGNGPEGGSINVLAIYPAKPTALYVGTEGGGVFGIQMVTAPAKVTISGLTTGLSNSAYAFTASVTPITTTTPITYVWEATGQSPITTTVQLTSTITFNWTTNGEKVITVTAKNAGGTSRATHAITIRAQYRIHLPLALHQSRPELAVDVAPGVALGVPRARHTATRLLDGSILLVGGQPGLDESLADADRFDPATSVITPAAPLHTPRHDHSATLLPDGRVLVVGGYTLPQQWLDDAEVYDPFADTWTIVPPLYSHGTAHTATLMKDGRVLVVGGGIGNSVASERAEIFDPQTNSWAAATSLESDRVDHTAVLLDDGRVLVVGGAKADGGAPAGGDALLYDPQTDTWTPTKPMVKPRYLAQSVRLSDGRVLVAGGMTLEDKPLQKISASAEIYDPTSNAWTAAAALAEARYAYVLLLSNGQVLAVGGARDYDCCWTESSFVHEIEVYDPVADRWHTADELPQPGANTAAALLPDGRLWVTGGQAGQFGATFWSDTWLIAILFGYDRIPSSASSNSDVGLYVQYNVS
jgi:hypothetical protein